VDCRRSNPLDKAAAEFKGLVARAVGSWQLAMGSWQWRITTEQRTNKKKPHTPPQKTSLRACKTHGSVDCRRSNLLDNAAAEFKGAPNKRHKKHTRGAPFHSSSQ
jgi:hypothetical protein